MLGLSTQINDLHKLKLCLLIQLLHVSKSQKGLNLKFRYFTPFMKNLV